MVPMAHYRQSAAAVLQAFHVDAGKGLSLSEVAYRQDQYGPNRLAEPARPSLLIKFLSQFQDFMVLVLIGAILISAFLGEMIDAAVIMAIVFCNALLGFIQEYKAGRSLEALQDLAAPTCVVLREGRETVIETIDLVPGDIVMLQGGQRIPADGRLIDTNLLAVEEAALTGESHPISKLAEYTASCDLPLGDRKNSVFMGTAVMRGNGRFVVTDTGMNTEIGKIAGMIQAVSLETTPLQDRLAQLGQWLVASCLVVVLVVFATGVLRGFPVYRMFLTGVSLAVAAIPEGLPAVVTIALAIGVQRMSRRKAIVRHLPAVETLGCATVICSDKTGTLTQNVMTMRQIYMAKGSFDISGSGYSSSGEIRAVPAAAGAGLMQYSKVGRSEFLSGNSDLERLLLAGVLCNNARIYPVQGSERGFRGILRKFRRPNTETSDSNEQLSLVGDPTEGALLVAAAKAGIYREEVEQDFTVVGELPFDSRRKRMTVLTESKTHGAMAWIKGAPDVILGLCTHQLIEGEAVPLTIRDKQEIQSCYEKMSSAALRVLALAQRRYQIPITGNRHSLQEADVERRLTFLGLVGIIDPARPEAVRAIGLARRAGIRTIMVTGDHANTAQAIARELGLSSPTGKVLTGKDLDQMSDGELAHAVTQVNVFARVQPEHKVRIVAALQNNGEIVGMTGDGVNDGPAVREADIGIAMGLTGTDVTKEASDIILADDNFATIVAAIEEGRVIYDNIRKFIRYLLGCNVGEVLTMFLATLIGLPLPLLPIQILWMNLVTDGLPAIALSVDPGDPDIMNRPPRPAKEGIFARGLHARITAQGTLIGTCTLLVFVLELVWGSSSIDAARTMAFTTLVFSQLFFVFQCRSEEHRVWEISIFENLWLVGAVCLSIAAHLGIVYLPAAQPIFKTVALSPGQWAVIMFFSGWCAVFVDVVVHVFNRAKKRLAWLRV
ncbi:MAG: cation-translocating P-type ATPase [Firmicutes bacterium]|nr:cation-translocating P-type ATPase [Bacillota bacterium]